MPEKIRILIREQIIPIISTLTALLRGIATIVLSVIGDFGGVRGVKGPSSKDKDWLDRMADAFKSLTGKGIDALAAIVGNIFGIILDSLKKVVESVTEHTWALIVFAAWVIGWWLMQIVKKS